jgi:sensor histidine kinase YesM
MKQTTRLFKVPASPFQPGSSYFFTSFFLLLTLFVLLFFANAAHAVDLPMAVEGQLDLKSWDFEKDGSVELNGEWTFYWNKLLTPKNFKAKPPSTPTGFFNVPGFWNNYNDHGNRLNGDGFATFHLKVRLKHGHPAMALRLEDQSTAYRLWVNGKMLMSNGTVAESRPTSTPQYLVKIAALDPVPECLDLILQISNFHLHRGGPYRSISLGIESQVRKKQMLLWGIDLLTFAILVIVGLHHVVFYLLRHKELASLYFGLFCLLWGLHIPFWGAGGKFITVLFPHFNWEIAHKLDLLTWYATVPLLLMFIATLYPRESGHKLVRLYPYAAIPFLLTVLFTPPRIAGYSVLFYEFYALLNIPPIAWILYRALGGKRKGSGLIVFGFVLFIITAINDILYNMGLVYSVNLIPVGLLGLILSQSFELARRYASAYRATESLSITLEKTNTALTASNQDLKKSNLALEENLRLKTALEDQRQKKQQALLHAEKTALEKLRYQLNPHFLFNALTSIRGAVGKKPDLAMDMIGKLAEFYRRTLVYGKKDLVSVAEAVELNRLYLDMERIRLGNYLNVTTNLEHSIENKKISSMLLQPLVENAVKYGRLTSPDALEIIVNVRCPRPGRLSLEVVNTGRWVEPGVEENGKSTGIGLENLRQRLDNFYPGAHDFNVESGSGRVAIRIEIPV